MVKKLPDLEAFQYYVSLGLTRSYSLVARKFNASRRAVTSAAQRGNWTVRLAEIEREAQVRSDKKLTETLSEVRDRHLKMCRAIQSRGLQAIQAHQLDDAMQGAKAIDMAVKLERIILGEPDARTAVSVEELTRREVETLLAHPDEPEDASGNDVD